MNILRTMLSLCLAIRRHTNYVVIAMKRCNDHGNSYKGKHLFVADLQFRGLFHCPHGRKHGSTQVDMVLEMELGVRHIY